VEHGAQPDGRRIASCGDRAPARISSIDFVMFAG